MTATSMKAPGFQAVLPAGDGEVTCTGQPVTITKRGKSLARIVLAREDAKDIVSA